MTGSFILLVFLAVVVVVLSRWLSSPEVKGRVGEQAVHNTLAKALRAPDYTILRDVTLRTERGTTQIDHLVVSPFGIFVIETKNLSGWIFGAAEDREWTQSFRRSRVRFQNPLRQNYAHIRALQELLGLDAAVFHSIVVFTGTAEFKKLLPLNVIPLGRLSPYIQVRSTPLLSPEQVERAVQSIEAGRLQPGAATDALHIESLRATHGSFTGAVRDARGLMQHGIKTLIAVKVLAGVAAILLLLVSANLVINAVSELLEVGSVRPAMPSASRPTNSPPPTALQTLQQQQALREQQREQERDRAWRASLKCAYSTDTMRCACYDPKVGKVAIPFDECKALADGAVP
jgi:hypothetical protein